MNRFYTPENPAYFGTFMPGYKDHELAYPDELDTSPYDDPHVAEAIDAAIEQHERDSLVTGH